MKYSKEFKEQAIKLSDEIGVKRNGDKPRKWQNLLVEIHRILDEDPDNVLCIVMQAVTVIAA